MNEPTRKTLTLTLGYQAFLALLIFGSAGTLRYWQGWVYWTLFGVTSVATALYFTRTDPALVERRLKVGPTAEPRPIQRWIQTVTSLSLLTIYIVAGLDRRFGWSTMPAAMAWVGNALVVGSNLAIFLVLRANSYAAATIRVETGQPVISTGPYAIVRHPMYAAATIMFLETPFALGSYRALWPAVLVVAAMMVRLLDEEKVLSAELPGYDEYRRKVRWRIFPFVW